MRGGIDGDSEAGRDVDSMFKFIAYAVLDHSEGKDKLHSFEDVLGDLYGETHGDGLSEIERDCKEERYLG